MGTPQKKSELLGLSPDQYQGPALIQNFWDDYRKIARMNPSTIVLGLESRLHLLDAIQNGGYEPTPAMMLGTGIHALTLEPEVFEDTFCVVPDFHLDPGNTTVKGEPTQSRATNYYRERYGEFLEANKGKAIIQAADYQAALKAVRAINGNERARSLIEDSMFREVTVVGEIRGVRFKGRIDLLGSVIGDIKTTVSVCPFKFSRQFNQLHYCQKMATYRELVRQATGDELPVEIIAVEKKRPFDVAVFPVDASQLDRAFQQVEQLVEDYLLAVETDFWPGRDRGQGWASLVDELAYGRHTERKADGIFDSDEAFDWESDEVDESLVSEDLL